MRAKHIMPIGPLQRQSDLDGHQDTELQQDNMVTSADVTADSSPSSATSRLPLGRRRSLLVLLGLTAAPSLSDCVRI